MKFGVVRVRSAEAGQPLAQRHRRCSQHTRDFDLHGELGRFHDMPNNGQPGEVSGTARVSRGVTWGEVHVGVVNEVSLSSMYVSFLEVAVRGRENDTEEH